MGAGTLRPWGAGEGGWSLGGPGWTFGCSFRRTEILPCSIGHRPLRVRCPKRVAVISNSFYMINPNQTTKLGKTQMLKIIADGQIWLASLIGKTIIVAIQNSFYVGASHLIMKVTKVNETNHP